ncbi:nitronate monooxygenase [Bosea sp. NBC_00550]|nr:nitronate monooxygenase [Bosea sp. NBC_00550]
MLSFGDPTPFAAEIAAAGVPLICQCQSIAHVRQALDAGAAIIVAQGAEAGGHGHRRATLPFVPEAADLIARESPDTLLLAAGGIADGRGLAAALMLGADGVLVGTRFWASREALVHERHHGRSSKRRRDHTFRIARYRPSARLAEAFRHPRQRQRLHREMGWPRCRTESGHRDGSSGLSRGLHGWRSREGGRHLRRVGGADLRYPPPPARSSSAWWHRLRRCSVAPIASSPELQRSSLSSPVAFSAPPASAA